MYAHRAFGTEFLTAETADAAAAIDLRTTLLHLNGMRGANRGALAAADAVAGGKLRARGEKASCGARKQMPEHRVAAKLQIDAAVRLLKIGDGKVLRAAADVKLAGVFRAKVPRNRGADRRHGFGRQADHARGAKVECVGGF